jgi:hypothetical protein
METKAVLIIRLKGAEAREEVIKCESIQEAKDVRKEMFATRQDISFAIVMKEEAFQESI